MNLNGIADEMDKLLRHKTVAENGGYSFGPYTMGQLCRLIKLMREYEKSCERLRQHRDELQEHSNEQLFKIRELKQKLLGYSLPGFEETIKSGDVLLAGQSRMQSFVEVANMLDDPTISDEDKSIIRQCHEEAWGYGEEDDREEEILVGETIQ